MRLPFANWLSGLDERTRRLLLWAAAAVAVALALTFRLLVVASWHAPAGDGIQYYRLAQELRQHHRFAYGPLPAALTHTRLPGYPLFLAFLAVLPSPASLETHLRWATAWNVFLDVGTALLLFGLLRERRRSLGVSAFAALLVVVCPLLLFLSTFALSESFATFLATCALFCVVRWMKRPSLWYPVVAGVAVGFSLLTRVDTLSLLPPLGIGFLLGDGTWRRRLIAASVFGAAMLVTFAPWPIRNLAQFGAPHPEGTTWVRQDGTPQTMGMLRWMRTYGTGAPGEAYLMLLVANNQPINPNNPKLLIPNMYDDEAERLEVKATFELYNRELVRGGLLVPAVDAAFEKLARERTQKAPFRTFVKLPLARLISEWQPIPEYELPVRTALLQLPQRRAQYGRFEQYLFVLAAIGLLALCLASDRDRTLALILFVMIATRSLLHAYAHPYPVERYLAEVFPELMALSAFGVWGLARWVQLALRRLPARRTS